jgi:DNA-binding transcriptional regulator YhcF (GntR family)
MTQEQLASVFGVHRATLARAIQHLKQEAIIACFTCRRVEIIDMERLRHMAHL